MDLLASARSDFAADSEINQRTVPHNRQLLKLGANMVKTLLAMQMETQRTDALDAETSKSCKRAQAGVFGTKSKLEVQLATCRPCSFFEERIEGGMRCVMGCGLKSIGVPTWDADHLIFACPVLEHIRLELGLPTRNKAPVSDSREPGYGTKEFFYKRDLEVVKTLLHRAQQEFGVSLIQDKQPTGVKRKKHLPPHERQQRDKQEPDLEEQIKEEQAAQQHQDLNDQQQQMQLQDDIWGNEYPWDEEF